MIKWNNFNTVLTFVDSYEKKTPRQVIDELRESEPSVVVRQDSDAVVIDPMTLMPGEEEIIAKRLLDVLKG